MFALPAIRSAAPRPLPCPPIASARQLVARVAKLAERSDPDLAALEAVLVDFAARGRVPGPETWPDTTGRYTRVLLNDPEDRFQIVVVFWPPGSRSAIHDHAETHGAVMCLFGEVRETKYARRELGKSRVALEAVADGPLRVGEFSPITPEDGAQLHDMVNASQAWAATIHVYLRAIDRFGVYRATDGGSFVREGRSLWFDYCEGAARWDRPAPAEGSEPSAALAPRGGCACGSVSLELDAEPVLELSCYCSDCRRSTGSTHAPLAFYAREQVEIRGELRCYARRNDSGHQVGKRFCPECGTTVLHESESHPQLVGVPVGVLDDAEGFCPTTNVYVGSAPSWAPISPTFARRR